MVYLLSLFRFSTRDHSTNASDKFCAERDLNDNRRSKSMEHVHFEYRQSLLTGEVRAFTAVYRSPTSAEVIDTRQLPP